MLLNSENVDPFFSRVVLGESKERASLSKLALIMTLTASMACALFASYVIYNVFILGGYEIPAINKEMIMKKVAEYQLELRTGGDPYLKDGYTKIAVVESSDEDLTQPVVVVSDYEVPIDKEAQPELFTAPIKITGEPKKRKIDKRALITPMFTGNYSIQFLDINEEDAKKVKILADNNDFNLTKIGSNVKSRKKWQAYKENNNSKTVIAGKNVSFLKSFNSRSAAVKYLQKKKIAGVVATKTTYYNYYDLEVCCLGSEAAQKMAHGSGVSFKKIKILKK